jgi:hypothetical protein
MLLLGSGKSQTCSPCLTFVCADLENLQKLKREW